MKLYCNTMFCIVAGRLAGEKICFAIQKLYCDSWDSGLLDCVATQGRDTALGAAGERLGELGEWLGEQLGEQRALACGTGAQQAQADGRAGRAAGRRAGRCWAQAAGASARGERAEAC